MVLSTIIYRADGLPLSSSVDDDQNDAGLLEQKKQAKLIVRKITPHSEPRASIDSGDYTILYLLENGIIYICICDKSYPKKLGFSYLAELSKEFQTSYGERAHSPELRPFAFNEFDGFMQKTKRLYQDAKTTQSLDRLNADLQDVSKVMTKNIEDLLYRGDSLEQMSNLSSSLKAESKKYRKSAQKINLEALIKQYIPVVGLGLIFVFLFWWVFLR